MALLYPLKDIQFMKAMMIIGWRWSSFKVESCLSISYSQVSAISVLPEVSSSQLCSSHRCNVSFQRCLLRGQRWVVCCYDTFAISVLPETKAAVFLRQFAEALSYVHASGGEFQLESSSIAFFRSLIVQPVIHGGKSVVLQGYVYFPMASSEPNQI